MVVADEPGAWETLGGEAMYRTLETALGKPDAPMRAIIIGTIAPTMGGWWPDLLAAGNGPGRHVYALQGDYSHPPRALHAMFRQVTREADGFHVFKHVAPADCQRDEVMYL